MPQLRVGPPPASWLAVFVVVVPMLVLAAALDKVDVIFPEAAALAFGVLALRLPGWTYSPFKLALVPPVYAAGGVALAHLDWPRWLGVTVALTGAAAGLKLVRTRLAPSLSAGVFPLVFDVRTWVLPLTVLALCVFLSAVVVVRRRRARIGSQSDRVVLSHEGVSVESVAEPIASHVLVATWATAVAWVLVAWPVLGLRAAAVAPPLVVAMLERTMSANPSARTGVRHWAALVVAALVGSVLAAHVDPAWIGGVLAVALMLVVFRSVSGPHPPALAICLIPQVSGAARDVAPFVANIAIGSAVLYVGAMILSRGVRSLPFEGRLAWNGPAE
ncbi:MAG: hypothetical protein AB7L13_15315 [Acidimicrobiia bacterium]